MEEEAQESNSQNDAVISSSCEITSASKQEALFFVESHNWNLDAAVSTFQDNNVTVLAAATELGVENHDAGADVADDVEAESNVTEHEKHTNLRTQDPSPERSMEASCGAATVVFADLRSEDEQSKLASAPRPNVVSTRLVKKTRVQWLLELGCAGAEENGGSRVALSYSVGSSRKLGSSSSPSVGCIENNKRGLRTSG
ncbi:hypothetical protein ACFX2G_004052 [Malus domestica]